MQHPTQPTETILEVTDTEQQLSRVVNRVARGETRVVVEQDGSPVAAIISLAEYRRLLAEEARREERFAALQDISAAFADVPDDELERELARAQANAREQFRAEHGERRPNRHSSVRDGSH